MVHLLLKSLFLYSALAVLAAPTHQHQTERLIRGASPREELHPPHLLTGALREPVSAAIDKRSQEEGGGVRKVTNAIRIANGLPPLAPRKLCELFQKRLRCT